MLGTYVLLDHKELVYLGNVYDNLLTLEIFKMKYNWLTLETSKVKKKNLQSRHGLSGKRNFNPREESIPLGTV